jgi:hypothetical protein
MKRMVAVYMAVAAMLALLLSGCGQAPVSGPASEFEKLWSVGADWEGFSQTNAAREVIRKDGTVTLRLTIRPEAFHRDEPMCTETIKMSGRIYKTGKGFECWDGPTGGGTDYLQDVQWRDNVYSCLLSAKADNPYTRLDIASPETAALLERDPLAEVRGYPLDEDYWWTSLHDSSVTLYISLRPEPVGEDVIRRMINFNPAEFLTEDGVECYRYLADGTDGRLARTTMLWRTDKGYFYLYADRVIHVETPDGALDFVNAGLAKNITEQMGCSIVPFGEAR